jgi:hypothetical protein
MDWLDVGSTARSVPSRALTGSGCYSPADVWLRESRETVSSPGELKKPHAVKNFHTFSGFLQGYGDWISLKR